MKIKIKKQNSNAAIPRYSKPGDAGLDLTAVEAHFTGLKQLTYDTGISIEIPEGYVGLVVPRSSIKNYSLSLSNSLGIIDSGYRGTIKVVFNIRDLKEHNYYNIGERIAQLIILPYPSIQFEEVQELSSSERGTGGFGSSNIYEGI